MIKLLLKAELPILVAAGIVGQKIAAALWKRAAGDDIPDTAQRNVTVPGLLAAAVVEGTFYKLLRMAMDRGLREAARRSEGRWIGKAGEGE